MVLKVRAPQVASSFLSKGDTAGDRRAFAGAFRLVGTWYQTKTSLIDNASPLHVIALCDVVPARIECQLRLLYSVFFDRVATHHFPSDEINLPPQSWYVCFCLV